MNKKPKAFSNDLILLTGATGYVGGRLLNKLQMNSERIRCLARKPEFLKPKVCADTEVVKGDLLDPITLERTMRGVHTAYYLVHSMASMGSFEQEDRQAALNFVKAADEAGINRIIYLGGLGDPSTDLSAHLRSRQEVGKILRTAKCQVIEFRASIVIGSGSFSFEMIRALVDRLPVMIAPKWVGVKAQPISIMDLISYLSEVLYLSFEEDRIFEIGGKDIVSYRDIMLEYAKIRKLKRIIIPIPVLTTPRLSSMWVRLFTPIHAHVGRHLIDSAQNETIVQERSANKFFNINPVNINVAIKWALINEDSEFAQTRWSDSLTSSGPTRSFAGVRFHNRIYYSRTRKVSCHKKKAFAPIQLIGGERGWYFLSWMWKLRGFIDLFAGGVGLRRGRSDPIQLHEGDTLDWWRIEKYEEDTFLRLFSEMRVPGRAWLEFEVKPDGDGSIIRQTAVYDPKGLWGQIYWYALLPVHIVMFWGMLRNIARAAERS